jgi:hypothetical protein
MLSSLLAVPSPIPEPGIISDSVPHESLPTPTSTHFPHTRAQLTAIARLYKPADSVDSDAEPDDSRVSSSLVAKVASLLDHEHEDELKALLRASFAGIDDNMVRSPEFVLVCGFFTLFPARATRTRLDAQAQG